MYYGSETIKINQQECYVDCYFLKSRVLKSEMIELVKIIKNTFDENKKPITVNFPNIGFVYVFESMNDIQNFELTITILIPYIIDRMISSFEVTLDKEKKDFNNESSDVIPA